MSVSLGLLRAFALFAPLILSAGCSLRQSIDVAVVLHLRGSVTGVDGVPIKGATIFVSGLAGSALSRDDELPILTSDTSGKFDGTLDQTQAGSTDPSSTRDDRFRIVVRAEGFRDQVRDFRFRSVPEENGVPTLTIAFLLLPAER